MFGSFIEVSRVSPRPVSMDCRTRWTRRPVLVLPVSPTCCLVLGNLLHLTLSLSFLICDVALTMVVTSWDNCEQLGSV